jgi:hypothetical protein
MIKLQSRSRIISHDEILQVFRENKVVYVNGKPVNDNQYELLFEITCNVQPMTGIELLIVPEGDRHRERFWVYAEQSEKLETPIQVNDRIVRNEINYQVQSIEPWGSFSKIQMVRDDVGPLSGGQT